MPFLLWLSRFSPLKVQKYKINHELIMYFIKYMYYLHLFTTTRYFSTIIPFNIAYLKARLF